MTSPTSIDGRLVAGARFTEVTYTRYEAPIRTRAIALSLSLILQFAILAALALTGKAPSMSNAPAMIVGLVPDVEHVGKRKLAQPPPEVVTPPAQSERISPTPTASIASPTGSQAQVARSRAPPESPDGLVAAVRLSLGCAHPDFYRLTPGEQDTCEQHRIGAEARNGSVQFEIAPEKRAAFAAEDNLLQRPFLAERPTNGCRPRVTEETLNGQTGRAPQDWTGGVTCGLSF